MTQQSFPWVVLVEPEQFAEVTPAVIEAAETAGPLAALPFFLVDGADPGLAGLSHITGVLGVVPGNHLILSTLQGLDRVALLCLGLVEDWIVGGVATGQSYPYVFEEPRGTAASPAVCAAVNLSLTPPNEAFAPTLETDVINHATRTVSSLTIPVVAAGNHHQREYDFETVSPWAEPDWVLSVGATLDEAGEVEWTHSARGSAVNPEVGPDLLTWGQDALSDEGFGTSFAAARMSQMVAICRAWLFEVSANVDRLRGLPFGVPQVGVAVVDRGLVTMPPAVGSLAALPVLAATTDAFNGLVLEVLAKALHGWGAIVATKRLILAAASETTPTTASLSAPSLTPQRLKEFLDRLTLARLVTILDCDVRSTTSQGSMPIFSSGTADQLWALVRYSQPAWGWDIDTQTPRLRGIVGGPA